MSKGCFICGSKKDLTKHHGIPLSLGGENRWDNIITLCDTHHQNYHKHFNKNKTNDIEKYLRKIINMKINYSQSNEDGNFKGDSE